MSIGRRLHALAFVVLLAVAFWFGAALVHAIQLEGGVEAEPFVIPVGGTQDEFMYKGAYGWIERFSNGTVASDSMSIDRAFRFHGVHETPDRQGLAHTTLRGTTAADDNALAWTELNLTTRDPAARVTVVQDGGVTSVSHTYGPRLWAHIHPTEARDPAMAPASWALVRWQGVEIGPGKAMPVDEATLRGAWERTSWLTLDRWEMACDVGTPGIFEDRRVTPVECEERVSGTPHGTAWPDQAFHAHVGRDTFWFAPTVPYPVRVETSYAQTVSWSDSPGDPPTKIYRYVDSSVHVLADYEPGGQEIPWAAADEDANVWDSDPTLERSSGTGPPEEGRAPSHAYRLSDAIRAVESDATLADFQAWRRAHPDSVLIGFAYRDLRAPLDRDVRDRPTPGTGDPVEWYLTFAGGDGTGIVVAWGIYAGGVQVNADGSRPCCAVDDVGLFQHDLGDPGSAPFPSSPITLAEAERVAERILGEDKRGEGPIGVRYGFQAYPVAGESMQGQAMGALGGLRLEYEVVSADGRWATSRAALEIDVRDGMLLERTVQEYLATPITLMRTVPPGPASQPGEQGDALGQPVVAYESGLTVLQAGLLSVLAVALLASLWPSLKTLAGYAPFLIPGFARLRSDRVLDSALRRELHDIVVETPALNATEIHSRVDAGWSTVIYQLAVLTRNDLLTSIKCGRSRRYFQHGAWPLDQMEQMAVLRNENTARILKVVAAHPSMGRDRIARRIGVSGTTARWHLTRLRRCGLVESTGTSARPKYRADRRLATRVLALVVATETGSGH